MRSSTFGLQPGDAIGVVSPAMPVAADTSESVSLIREWGYRPVVPEGAFGGRLSAGERAGALRRLLCDESIKAVWCTFGGYGCVELLHLLGDELFNSHRVPIIGCSDISLLHARALTSGGVGIHGPNLIWAWRHPEAEGTRSLRRLLGGEAPDIRLNPSPFNITGTAMAPMVGGNLITLNNLAQTSYDILRTCGAILFLEEKGEKPHAIDRMMQRLHLSGTLSQTAGLVFGDFVGCPDAPERIGRRLREWGYRRPVAFGYPAAHGADNIPFVQGAETILNVTENHVEIQQTF